MQIQRLLVPVDFSECSKNALSYAIDLATGLSASIDVLHVWRPPYLVAPDLVLSLPHQPPMSIQEWAEQEVRREMTEFLKPFSDEGLPMKSRIDQGAPDEVIVATAHEGYDLVVMGTVGRTGIARWLLGSVAEKVVRSCSVPVVTVHITGANASPKPASTP